MYKGIAKDLHSALQGRTPIYEVALKAGQEKTVRKIALESETPAVLLANILSTALWEKSNDDLLRNALRNGDDYGVGVSMLAILHGALNDYAMKNPDLAPAGLKRWLLNSLEATCNMHTQRLTSARQVFGMGKPQGELKPTLCNTCQEYGVRIIRKVGKEYFETIMHIDGRGKPQEHRQGKATEQEHKAWKLTQKRGSAKRLLRALAKDRPLIT